MADTVACLNNGKVTVIRDGHEPEPLESPYAKRIARRDGAIALARIVGVTRGRVPDELCYVINTASDAGVFAQKLGTGDEQRLFQGAGVQLADLDFSFGDDAFTCTIAGHDGSSAIGVLADDGKGVRTVTEGDVLDRGPRWVPGGRGEITYSSAGIGRTRAGAWAARTPYSLHRLSLKDGTVEVLVSDAKYDYLAPLAAPDGSIYAIRRAYEAGTPRASFGAGIRSALLRPLRSLFAPGLRGGLQPTTAHAERMMVWGDSVDVGLGDEQLGSEARSEQQATRNYELVRATAQRIEVVASGVIAFDVASNGDIVYSSGSAVYRTGPGKGRARTLLAQLEHVEQIVIG